MNTWTVPISVGLHPRDHAVLRLLAQRGPLNKYRILKDLPAKLGSRPTILEYMQRLENDHLIRVHHVQTHARGMEGVSRYYDLTLLGLVWVIGALTDKDRRLLDEFAVKYQNLEQDGMRLFIFDLWPNIRAAGIQDKVSSALVSICHDNPSLDSLQHINAHALLLPVFKMSGPLDWLKPKEGEAATSRYLLAARKDKVLRTRLLQELNAGSKFLQLSANELMGQKAEIDRIAATMERE